jgi:D-alanine-D-alanine ligase
VTPRLRVAVLAGGRSSEHDVSLASARSVREALDPERYEVVALEISRDGCWELPAGDGAGSPAETLPVPARGGAPALGSVDVVLPILHGPFGEDGTVQGLLELADVPYVGAGVLASALCMDKDVFKAVLRDRGIPVARNVTLREGDPIENPFGYPVFVKPARLGSSIGITKAHDEAELEAGVVLARRHDDKVLVEEFVPGVEVECSVLGNRQPPPIASLRVQQLAIETFVATECEGLARVDFFVRDDGEVIVNELNTMPGFTATSVYAKLFEASGIPYGQLLDRLIALALERHERRSRLAY